jgi:CTP synthase (UTP-ammonia lyase)
MCRSATAIDESVRDKLSMFSHVAKEQVICLPDVSTLYKVPVILKDLKIDEWFCERLLLNEVKRLSFGSESQLMANWRDLAYRLGYFYGLHFKFSEILFEVVAHQRAEHLTKEVTIGLIGKYIKQPVY